MNEEKARVKDDVVSITALSQNRHNL